MIVRFCLRCGRRLRAWREGGRVRRRCPACGWTWYGNPVPAVVALITRRGRVLLTRRARAPYAGTWDVPGGFLEADERPEAGLRRELEEELGITPRRQRLLGFATDRYGRGGFPILTLLYRVMPRPGAFQPADDVAEARWFPRAAMPWRQIAFPGLRRLLQHHLAPRRPANPRRPRASR